MMAGDSDDEEQVEEAANIYTIPAGADFLMCYSVAEGEYERDEWKVWIPHILSIERSVVTTSTLYNTIRLDEPTWC